MELQIVDRTQPTDKASATPRSAGAQRLSDIQQRCDAASLSGAPWLVRESAWEGTQTVEGPRGFDDRRKPFHILIDEPADADFIAHSREDIPWLLALVAEQARALDEVEALCGALETNPRSSWHKSNALGRRLRVILATRPDAPAEEKP